MGAGVGTGVGAGAAGVVGTTGAGGGEGTYCLTTTGGSDAFKTGGVIGLGSAGTAGAKGNEGASNLGTSGIFGKSGTFGMSGILGSSNLGAEKDGMSGIFGVSNLGTSTLGAEKDGAEKEALGVSEELASGFLSSLPDPKNELKGSLSVTGAVGAAIRFEEVFAAFSYCLTVSDLLARKFLSICS